MAYEEILYEVSESIATLTLNRPAKLNAWTTKMEKEVAQALLTAEHDEKVRVIILTGAGRGFCAGADMANLDGLASSNRSAKEIKQALGERFNGPRRDGSRRNGIPRCHPLLRARMKGSDPLAAALISRASTSGSSH